MSVSCISEDVYDSNLGILIGIWKLIKSVSSVCNKGWINMSIQIVDSSDEINNNEYIFSDKS